MMYAEILDFHGASSAGEGGQAITEGPVAGIGAAGAGAGIVDQSQVVSAPATTA
jgi:hypothetical protein